MTDNDVMQDSGAEWIGAIPLEWRLDRLKDIVSLRDEKSTEKSEIEDYLELEDLDQGTGRLLSVRNTTNVESAVMKFYKNDVLFGKLRPYLRKYHLATFDGKCTGEILAFQPEKIEAKFLLYFIASDGFIKVCTAMSYGAKMTRVNYPKQLALLPVCLPSTQEQQAIAEYLDQRCGRLDAIIAIKQRQIKTLDALRQSIIYQAVTKGLDDSVPLVDSGVEWLGKIPQGWRVSKLKYITNQIVDGTHFTPNYVESGVPFLRVTDIQTQSINFERIKFITKEEHTELTKRAKPQKGDILLSKNGTIGITKVVDWDWEFSIFVSLCLIKFLPNISPYYFSYFFESDVVNQQLFESSKKTSVTNLHLVKIRELLLCVPPFHEQQRIIDHLDQETQRLNDLKENLSKQISTLEAYKKALIYECVTGKKRINADGLRAF